MSPTKDERLAVRAWLAVAGGARVSAPRGLARRTLGAGGLFFFSVGASAPMTVLAGGIVAAYTAGPVGVAAAFVLLTVSLRMFSVGHVAMSRHGPHAGPLYAQVSRGLGPVAGVGAAAVALLSYNAIAICLYGLLGATLAGLLGGLWWVWALAVWGLVGLLGVLHVKVNASLLALLLVVEIAVVVLFDLAALTHPATGGVEAGPLLPTGLFTNGVGGVLALCVACFVGFETVVAYGEEARTHRALARASLGSLLSIGVLYAVTAWAYALAAGPAAVVPTARTVGAELVFDVLGTRYGLFVRMLAGLLLVTSMFAAILSFHGTVARYAYAMGREGLLPTRFGRVGQGRRGGVPVGGSLLQSTVAVTVVVAYALAGVDPVAGLFTQLAAVAAIGVMGLMVAACVAALRFFRRGGGTQDSAWVRVVAPGLGAVAVGGLLVVMVANLESLLGAASAARWLLPGVVVGTAVAGLVWGVALRRRPRVLAAVGVGEPEPLAELEHHLADVDV